MITCLAHGALFLSLVSLCQAWKHGFQFQFQFQSTQSTNTALLRSTFMRGGASSPNELWELVEEAIAANRKVVVVTGGVLSGIGKGVTASSIGVLFRAMGLRVTALKIDPYLNVDAGTMSPFEHGEVFVLDDGGETDLDLGNYERFLSVCLTKDSNLSTGKIYQQVIEKERVGDYLGKTVQVVPHVSDAIQEWVLKVAKAPVTQFSTDAADTTRTHESPEVCIVELGGTLGDIEGGPFVEALRQLQEKIGYKVRYHIPD
jgi:CTP synthase